MRKFFEKHDLIKLTGIVFLVLVLFTWLISSGVYSSGTIQYDAINRIGLFDIAGNIPLVFTVFFAEIIFLFAVGGFYKFLGSTEAYDNMTSKIASVFEGKEKVFVAISMLLFACLSGISTEQLVLVAFVPFFICILSKLKVDKVTGLISTFGGIMVGLLGATYSPKVIGAFTNAGFSADITYGYELVTIIIIFAISYLLLTYFAFARMNKNKDNKEIALLEDPFAREIVEEDKKSKKAKKQQISVVGLAVILVITFVTLILAFIGWETAFGVDIFVKAYEWVSNATIINNEVFAYILGIHPADAYVQNMFSEFGTWGLYIVSMVLLISALLIKLVYHIPFDKMLDEIGNGFKKISKSVFIAIFIYLIMVLSVQFPIIPSIVSKIVEGLGTNIGSLFVSGLLSSLMIVDFRYVLLMLGSLYQTFSNISVAAIILQTSYGLIQFIAPTSVLLMVGLSMLDIKFKDYFKFVWKFLLAMLIVVIVILAILMYV